MSSQTRGSEAERVPDSASRPPEEAGPVAAASLSPLILNDFFYPNSVKTLALNERDPRSEGFERDLVPGESEDLRCVVVRRN